MDIRNPRDIRKRAVYALEHANMDPRRLTLIYAGAVAAATFLSTLLNFILFDLMDDFGGLSGMGTRAVLQSIQQVVSYVVTLALPFWEMGFLYTMLRISRSQKVENRTLLTGFRRFLPVMGLMLIEGLMLSAVIMLCLYVSVIIYSVTPLSAPVYDILMPFLEQNLEPDPAAMAAAVRSLWPAALLFLIAFLGLGVPLLYRLRLSQLRLLDVPQQGIFGALHYSAKAMKGRCKAQFRLDLSFWWFYLLQILVGLIAYGDGILDLAGVALPMSDGAASLLFYGVAVVLQLGLMVWAKALVDGANAVFYDGVREEFEGPGELTGLPGAE